jgi:flavin reductase (DIM6/NTAB) family NADH-FMN oxidoreductase RutF
MSTDPQLIHNALRSLPNALFVLTCAFDKYRTGILTSWVQQCSSEPPILVVAVKKGQTIEPLLRDARAFVLNMMPAGDRRSIHRFGKPLDRSDDPFLSIDFDTAVTGMPILKNALGWFDCELEGHLSPDADCRLYLGRVVAANIRTRLKIDKPVSIVIPVPDKRPSRKKAPKKVASKRNM